MDFLLVAITDSMTVIEFVIAIVTSKKSVIELLTFVCYRIRELCIQFMDFLLVCYKVRDSNRNE